MSLLALGNNILLARIGGSEARGLYGLAVAVLAIAVPVCSLGLGQANTFMVARGTSKAAVATLSVLLLAVLMPICLTVGAVGLSGAVVELDVPLELAIVTATVALPMAVFLEAARGAYLGARRVWAYNGAQALTVASLLVLNATLLARGQRWALVNLAGSYWIVGVCVCVVMVLQTGLRWPGRALTAESVRYGFKAVGTRLAEAGLMRVDYLVMAPFVSLAGIGCYAISDQLTFMMAWVGVVAGKMMLAESSHDSTGESSLKKLGLAMRLYGVFFAGLGILGVATLWYLIPLLFGDEFVASYWGVLLLLPAAFFRSQHALMSTYLGGRGVQKPVVYAGAAALALDAIAVLLVAPRWGWLAVAGARSVAYTIQFVLTYRAWIAHLAAEGFDRPRLVVSSGDLKLLRTWVASRL